MDKTVNNDKILYSFDIFDTLISRLFATPKGVFYTVQEKLENSNKFSNVPKFLKDNFVLIRTEAEHWARENQLYLYGYFDATFDEIYKVISYTYCLSKETTQLLKDLEIEIEQKNIVPIQANIKKIKELINNGQDVILISDMYHSAETLKKILINIDPIFSNIRILSSADTRKRKSNGSIFRHLKETTNYKKYVHCGDNEFSDYTQAKWEHFDAINFKPCKLKNFEKNIIEKKSDSLHTSLSVGVSRYLRANSSNKIFDFAVSVAGPMLYSYVAWLLDQAQMRNIEHLYFVARDGYIPKIIADIIIKKKNLSIKTHLFYSSRRASRFPTKKNYESYINWIFSELQSFLSIHFVAERLNIDYKILLPLLNVNKDKLLSKKEFNKLKQGILNSEKIKKSIIYENRQKKELFKSYLKQQIDFDYGRFAFVDVNGTGRTQDNLVELISECNKEPVCSFYIKIQKEMQQNNQSIKLAYLNTIRYGGMIMELFCRTNFGQTIGYQKNSDGIIHPVLEYETNEYIEDWGFKHYVLGLKAYTELFCETLLKNDLNINDANLYTALSEFCTENPDREIAEVIGSIPFGVYGNEISIKECAPKYTIFNMLSNKTIYKIYSERRADFPVNIFSKYINKILNLKNYGYISKRKDLAYLKILGVKINIRNFIIKGEKQ